MKFNKNIIFQNTFLIFLFLTVSYIIYSTTFMPPEILQHESFNAALTFFIIIDIFVIFTFVVEIFTGDIYIEYDYIDANKFQIINYENRTIIVQDNWAWTYIDNEKKISKLKKIKIIKYYSIRKKFKNWKPLPWQS